MCFTSTYILPCISHTHTHTGGHRDSTGLFHCKMAELKQHYFRLLIMIMMIIILVVVAEVLVAVL